jgi:hypothetical protein
VLVRKYVNHFLRRQQGLGCQVVLGGCPSPLHGRKGLASTSQYTTSFTKLNMNHIAGHMAK